jgi:hypothetical protein
MKRRLPLELITAAKLKPKETAVDPRKKSQLTKKRLKKILSASLATG